MSRTLALVLVAGLALTLGGCGGGGDDTADDPAPGASPSPSPTDTGPVPPEATTGPDGGAAQQVTVTGRVSLGVEPGCTLLEGDGRLYQLIGGAEVKQLAEGDGVRVTGTVDPDTMTTCQQGTPLTVGFLERLG